MKDNIFTIPIFLLIFLLIGLNSSAQNKTTESSEADKLILSALLKHCQDLTDTKTYPELLESGLEAFLLSNTLKDDVSKVEACYYVAKACYYLREYDQCKYYGNIGRQLAETKGIKLRQAYFNNTLGIVERRMDNCDGAIAYYLKAIDLNKELRDSAQLGRNYNNLSICYRLKGEFKKTFDALNEGLIIRKALNDTTGIGNLYMSLGNGYGDINSHEKAIENYINAFEIYQQSSNKVKVAESLINIGLVYQNLSDYNSAIKYYEDAREIASKADAKQLLGIIYQNIGNVFGKQKNYPKSIGNLKNALRTFEEIDLIGSINDANLNIGVQYMNAGKLDSAQFFLLKSYKISSENPNSFDHANANIELGRLSIYNRNYTQANSYLSKGKQIAEDRNDLSLTSFANQYLYELSNAKGNNKEALSYYIKYRSQQDSLNLMQQEQTVTKIKANFDFEKQEAEIELLNKENLLNAAEVQKSKNQKKLLYSILGLMGVIIGGVSFLYWYSNKKNKVIIEEKTKAQNLLLNILPQEAAEELQRNGSVKAKRFEQSTVLFTDFVNFSSYSEHVNPEEVVKTIDFYFREFDKIVELHGVEKIKTIGDAYMCAGGLNSDSKDASYQVVRAAQEIIKFINQVEENPPPGIHPFKIRIGINSGPIVAGIVGINKFQYDIWGDAVNIASRMESHGQIGKIHISESTYNLIKDNIECEFMGETEVKNRGIISTYNVL